MKAVNNIVVTIGGQTIPGYNRDPNDLNLGAGGASLYLSYELVEEPPNPIRDLTVVWGDHDAVPAPEGYERIDHDLNQGVGGKFIYFCFRRGALIRRSGISRSSQATVPTLNRSGFGRDLRCWL
jgi:hypothetical protein